MREAYVNFQHGKYTVDVGDVFDFARKLERELAAVTEQRDEAREELAELKAEYGTWWAQKRIAIDELKEVTEQRDAGRREIKQLKVKRCEFCHELPQTENEKAYAAEFGDKKGELPTMDEWLQNQSVTNPNEL
jgi:uncharacterized coiled-coil DUF342 family protein